MHKFNLHYFIFFGAFLIFFSACNTSESNEKTNSKAQDNSTAQMEQTPSNTKSKNSAKLHAQAMDLNAFLEIDDSEENISFKLKKAANGDFEILNGTESIKITDYEWLDKDIVKMTIPVFNSQIKARYLNGNLLGEWIKNPGAEKEYKMNFQAFNNKQMNIIPPRFTDIKLQAAAGNKETSNIAGIWEVAFSQGTDDEYPAIGEFKQGGNDITGTFLTETGDYRFLAGKIYGEQFYLSCFDGSHAFLFTGKLENGTINGEFKSGKHWSEPWVAKRNQNPSLGNPYELTYLKKGFDKLDFEFTDLSGKKVKMQDLQKGGKSLVVQILGTWCPNCMDETALYTELYKTYKDKNIEFVGVAFERNGTLEKDKPAIDKYIEHFNIEYPILYGGKASKKLASELFPMLNEIISFPTTIVVNPDGEVVKVHTGFNGPATSVYQGFVMSFKDVLNKL